MHPEWILAIYMCTAGFPGGLVVKIPPAKAEDAEEVGSIHGPGRSPEGGNGNPLPYSCLEKSMDRRAWWATAHGVAKSRTQSSTEHTHNTESYTSLQTVLPALLQMTVSIFLTWYIQNKLNFLAFYSFLKVMYKQSFNVVPIQEHKLSLPPSKNTNASYPFSN